MVDRWLLDQEVDTSRGLRHFMKIKDLNVVQEMRERERELGQKQKELSHNIQMYINHHQH